MRIHTLILGSGSTPPKGIRTPVSTSARTIAPTGRISAELPCIECGFLLRGLSLSGRCPECGTEIQKSISGSILDDAEYARRGLEDYGTTLKFAILALLGFIVVPILGPFVAVVVFGAGCVRVSALERLRRAGFTRSWSLRPHLLAARRLAWGCAVFGGLVALILIHDSLGRWGAWVTPSMGLLLAYLWTLAIWSEVLVAAWLLRRAASILETGWLRWYSSIASLLIVAGLGTKLACMAIGFTAQPSGGALVALAIGEIVVSWLPLIVGGWMLGAAISTLGGAAPELHWLGAREGIEDEFDPPAPSPRSPRDDDPIPLD